MNLPDKLEPHEFFVLQLWNDGEIPQEAGWKDFTTASDVSEVDHWERTCTNHGHRWRAVIRGQRIVAGEGCP